MENKNTVENFSEKLIGPEISPLSHIKNTKSLELKVELIINHTPYRLGWEASRSWKLHPLPRQQQTAHDSGQGVARSRPASPTGAGTPVSEDHGRCCSWLG